MQRLLACIAVLSVVCAGLGAVNLVIIERVDVIAAIAIWLLAAASVFALDALHLIGKVH
jgi:hypothetical protein